MVTRQRWYASQRNESIVPKEAAKKESATPAKSPPRTYELLLRERKALKLANLCAHAKITAAEAESATEADWLLASKAAGCHPPSKETIKIVIAMLKERESKQD